MQLNTNKPTLTHYMTGFRVNYLNRMLIAFQELLNSHEEMYKNVPWYDGDFLNEDYEETLGFVFIAGQLFIAACVGDSFKSPDGKKPTNIEKQRIMKNAPLLKNICTKIELINAVANYHKHKEEGEILGDTRKILEAFEFFDEERPLIAAFNLITDDDKLETFGSLLIGWRNHLFNSKDRAVRQKPVKS